MVSLNTSSGRFLWQCSGTFRSRPWDNLKLDPDPQHEISKRMASGKLCTLNFYKSRPSNLVKDNLNEEIGRTHFHINGWLAHFIWRRRADYLLSPTTPFSIMCIYIYIYTCMCIYICVYIYIYMYTHTYVHVYLSLYIYIYICIHIYT